jgi:hypothetical protein
MDESLLGRRLRCERERRLITLESIAVNTKISIGLLRDLERDDLSRWPSGVFRRSFVRTYAEAIGLDGDDIVREFLERYPDAQHIEAVAALVASGGRPKTYPKTVLRLTLADTPPKPFSGGHLLKDVGARIKAVGWDCLATLVLAAVAFLILGASECSRCHRQLLRRRHPDPRQQPRASCAKTPRRSAAGFGRRKPDDKPETAPLPPAGSSQPEVVLTILFFPT